MMDVSEAKRLKDLEGENNELKKMLADSLLKNRVLEAINAKRWCARGTSDGWPPSLSKVGLCCGRAVCRYLGLSRATYRYRSRLVARIHALSAAHPRFGFRRIVALLRREGWSVSGKQVQRVRRAEGLQVPPPRKRQTRRGRSTGLPTKATHRGHAWTCDFIADAPCMAELRGC